MSAGSKQKVLWTTCVVVERPACSSRQRPGASGAVAPQRRTAAPLQASLLRPRQKLIAGPSQGYAQGRPAAMANGVVGQAGDGRAFLKPVAAKELQIVSPMVARERREFAGSLATQAVS